MWLADGFQLGSVKLATAKSYAAIRDSMLEMDDSVAEDDRVLAACISAGTKYGSREMLQLIHDEESILKGEGEHQRDKHDKVREWQAEAQAPEAEDNVTDANDDNNQATPKMKPKKVALKSPTHDPSSKYLFISPKEYKPSPLALKYQEKLRGMTKMETPPPGFRFIPEFITEEEERTLIRLAKDFRWEQDVTTRRTVQFGFKYNYKTKTISKGTPWIPELEWLRVKLRDAKIFDGLAHQCIVNEITPPNGFGAHIDGDAFADTIAILGTQSAVNFIVHDEERKEYYEERSKRRSLMVMQQEARYRYYHSIPEGIDDVWNGHTTARGVRISYTVRMMIEQYAVDIKQ